MKYGKLKGIVWHQGETDTSNSIALPHRVIGRKRHLMRVGYVVYVYPFCDMIKRLRSAMGVGTEVPVIVGELGQWEWEKKELIDTFNDVILPGLTNLVPNCHKVESDGLECRSTDHSDPHFSRESNIELGRRYAEMMTKITN